MLHYDSAKVPLAVSFGMIIKFLWFSFAVVWLVDSATNLSYYILSQDLSIDPGQVKFYWRLKYFQLKNMLHIMSPLIVLCHSLSYDSYKNLYD